jgi:hypothetical protein
MTRDQALYFLEGIITGIASPSPELAKWLFRRLATEHDLIPAEFETIRAEIDAYFDQAEMEVEESFKVAMRRAARG